MGRELSQGREAQPLPRRELEVEGREVAGVALAGNQPAEGLGAALVAVCREKIPRRPRALRTLVPHVSIGRAALVSYLGAPLPNVVIGPFGSGWTVQGVSVGYAVLVCLYLTVTPAATVRRA